MRWKLDLFHLKSVFEFFRLIWGQQSQVCLENSTTAMSDLCQKYS